MSERRYQLTSAPTTQEIIDTYSDRDRAFTLKQKRDLVERMAKHAQIFTRLFLRSFMKLASPTKAKAETGTEHMVNARELADILGWTQDTVYRKARAGAIPCVRLGKRGTRFIPSEVIQSLKNRST